MKLPVWLALIPLAASCATIPRAPAADAIDRALTEAMAISTVPGMAVIEIADGKIVRERVRGVRSAADSSPVQPGDVWHLGSNGKPIVTTLIAILVERGELSWNGKLATLLPALSPTIDPALRDATLLDLATHRSGLAENDDIAFIESFYGDTRPLTEQREVYLQHALAQAPAVARGTYQYSNTGFVALGAIAERVTGVPLERLLEREIFVPLMMKSAAFGPTAAGNPLGHEAGKPQIGEKADNPAFWTGAGTIRMSMADWARWSIDQIEGEYGRGKLLRSPMYRYLHTGQFTPPGRSSAVAVDWGVRQEPYGRLLTHSGSNGYWYAVIGLAPDARRGILVAANAAEDMAADRAVVLPYRAALAQWSATDK